MARKLIVEIIGDASSLERSFQQAGAQTQTFGNKIGGLGKTAALAAGGAGIGLLSVALHNGIKEYTESIKVGAQTERVIRNTGGAANVTAKHVDALAKSILNYSGIDDEAIKNSENLLLAFTGVRNEVGKGRDIFDRATKVIIDFSVATGRDARGATQLFGKALNEIAQGQIPTSIRGLGKLSKGLRDEIQAHVDAGDAAGAQAVLLTELEKRYGGAARAAGQTLPGQLSILREQFNNLAGQGVEVAIEKLQELRPTFEQIGKVISSLIPILQPLATLMFDVLVTPMKTIAALLTGDFAGAWEAVKKPIQDVLDLFGGVGEVFGGIAAKITGAAADAGTAAANLASGIWTSFTTALGDIAGYVGGQISGAISAITSALENATTQATAFGSNILTGMQAGILGFADWVGGRVTAAIGYLITGAATALAEATNFGAQILAGMKAGIFGFADWVSGRVDAAIGFLTDNAQKAYNRAFEFGSKIFDGVKAGIKDLYDLVAGPLIRAVGWIEDAAKGAYNKALAVGAAIYNGLRDGLGALLSFLNSIISAIRWIEEHKPGPSPRLPIEPPPPPRGQGMAAGGIVTRPTFTLIGEAGPEAVIPLNKMAGRAVNITVNLPNYLGEKDAVVAELRRELKKIGSNNAIDPLAAI